MTQSPHATMPRRPLRRIATAALTALLLVLGGLLAPSMAQAASGDPFPVGGGLVFVAQGAPTTRLFTAASDSDGNISFTPEGPNSGMRYNAIGFNEVDHYLYGLLQPDNNRLVRIGQGGVVTKLGVVSGLPVNDYNQGTFGAGPTATTLYVRDSAPNSQMYAIDVNTRVATRINLSTQVPNVADLVWLDGFVWALHGEGQRMYRIDPATGAVKSWPTASLGIPAEQHGAQWIYGNGNMGVSDNVTGQVTQVSIADATSANPTFAVVSRRPGPASANNDGAAYRGGRVDLSLVKSTNPVFVPGAPLTYTLTVTNNGPDPSSGFVITDQLPAALVDLSTAASGCTITGRALSCIGGALAVGESTTVEVTGRSAGGETECIENTATVVGNEADPAPENNSSRASTCPAPSVDLSLVKSATATFTPGESIRFTLAITNNSSTPSHGYTVVDEISSQLTDLSTVTPGCSFAGNTLTCTGASLAPGATTIVEVDGTTAVGETACVQNSASVVGVDADPDGSNNSGSTASCPIVAGRAFAVTKAASAETLSPGETLTYTVTVVNTGDVAFTSADPATFTDDLTAVLDDAVYNGDATGGAIYTEPVLTWSGALGVHATVSITYSVTARTPATGDLHLVNAVVPGEPGKCLSAPSCTTDVPVRGYTVAKTASVASTTPGGVVTYTVTVTNTGAVGFAEGNPATFSDDLTEVLDDAAYNDDASNGATFSGTTLSWAGQLPVGGSVSVTYSVTVADPDGGDMLLRNVVVPGADGRCLTAAGCTTQTPVAEYTVEKRVDVGPAVPGQVVTYEVVLRNTGKVAFDDALSASFSDDLSDVLDDATYNHDATGGAVFDGTTLTWTGPLDVGATFTVSYSFTVNDPATGDHHLQNTVVPGAGGECAAAERCTTTTPVAGFVVSKTVSADQVAPGESLRYTIVVTNVGATAFTEQNPASFSDDLASVLSGAAYSGDATSGATLTGTILRWSGPLGVGETVTVTYSVTVKSSNAGDQPLINVVVPGDGGACDPHATCEVSTPIPPPSWLAQTGAAVTPLLPYGVGALLVGALVLILGRRRHASGGEV